MDQQRAAKMYHVHETEERESVLPVWLYAETGIQQRINVAEKSMPAGFVLFGKLLPKNRVKAVFYNKSFINQDKTVSSKMTIKM